MPESPLFLTPEWADTVRDVVNGWPDEETKADPRKLPSYWAYFDRKKSQFDGVLAFGFRDVPGHDAGTVFVGLTFAGDTCTKAEILTKEQAETTARFALVSTYADWLNIIDGYDIGKAMTYHKLPLAVGSAAQFLKCVYFVHEMLVALSKTETDYAQIPALV